MFAAAPFAAAPYAGVQGQEAPTVVASTYTVARSVKRPDFARSVKRPDFTRSAQRKSVPV